MSAPRPSSAEGIERARLFSLARFRADARGSVALLVGGFGLCAVASLAVGVDVASVYLDKRRMQSAVDLAAIAAASDLANASAAARATLAANGYGAPKAFSVTFGNYAADPATAAGARFRANLAPLNAIRVEAASDAKLFFGRAIAGTDAVTVRASATAVNTQLASFSIGSRLASLNGGVANALLSALLGGSVSLSVTDYNALAAARVDMLPFLSALAARAGVTAGSYDQVLTANVRATDLVAAMADVAQGSASVAALRQIAATADASRRIDLAKILALGPYGKLRPGDAGSGLTVAASALDLLNASAQVANGDRQVALNLGAQVPGLLGVTAVVNIGERPQNAPWMAVDADDVVVRTAQTRVRLAVQVGGTGALLGKVVNLPIAIDLATAEARLSTVSCGRQPSADARVEVAVRPSAAEIWVGEPTSPTSWANGTAAPQVARATLLNLLNLVTVSVYAHAAATNVADQTLSYTAAEIRSGTSKTVRTTDAAQTTLASLTSSLDIRATPLNVLGLSLPDLATRTLLASLLTPVGALLDPVVNSLLDLLGVSIGEADVTVRGVRCDGAALVG